MRSLLLKKCPIQCKTVTAIKVSETPCLKKTGCFTLLCFVKMELPNLKMYDRISLFYFGGVWFGEKDNFYTACKIRGRFYVLLTFSNNSNACPRQPTDLTNRQPFRLKCWFIPRSITWYIPLSLFLRACLGIAYHPKWVYYMRLFPVNA